MGEYQRLEECTSKQNLEEEIGQEEKSMSQDCCPTNKKMLPAKAAYFFEYAKEGSHWPYLIIFYVSIGLNPAQAGLINGIRYTGSLVGAPLLGLFADKKQQHRAIAIVLCGMAISVNCLQPVTALVLGSKDQSNTHVFSKNNRKNNTSSDRKVAQQTNTENRKLFFILLLVSLVGSFFDGSTFTFVDSGILRRIQLYAKNSDIGRQRYIGPAGYAVGSLMSSGVISFMPGNGISPYASIFVVYTCVTTFLGISFFFLYSERDREKIVEPQDDTNITKQFLSTLAGFKTCFFLATLAFNGIPLAIIYSFTFLFLDELGAPNIMFGFVNTVDGIMSVIFYNFAKQIIGMVGGTWRAMSLSCFCWSIRFLCLSYMQRPMYILGINFLNGLCCSLFVCAYITYITDEYPSTICTVMCGVSSSLYNSFGYLLANIIGGEIYTIFGARFLFRACAIACALWGMLLLTYVTLEDSKSKNRKEHKKTQETGKG